MHAVQSQASQIVKNVRGKYLYIYIYIYIYIGVEVSGVMRIQARKLVLAKKPVGQYHVTPASSHEHNSAAYLAIY